MMTFVERVAQAIRTQGDLLDDTVISTSNGCRILAYAAIFAMHEPTDAMLQAGANAIAENHADTGWEALSKLVWQAMLDAVNKDSAP